MLAHRAAVLLHNGELRPYPEYELDHLCRNRACVNPVHLEFVSHATNVTRGALTDFVNHKKTHCKHGHPFDERNTYHGKQTNGGPRRACRECMRAYNKRRK